MDRSKHNRTYYCKHREKAIEKAKRYYYAHREERLAYQKKYQKEFLASLSPDERKEYYMIRNTKSKQKEV